MIPEALLAKTATTATSRALGLAGRYALNRRHSDAAIKALKQDAYTAELDLQLEKMSATQAQGIAQWMQSPSLNHFSLVVASHLIIGRPLSPQTDTWEEIHDEFAASLNLSLPLLFKVGEGISRHFLLLIVGSVTASVGVSMDISGLSPESKAMAIRTVAASAAARTRNSRILEQLDGITKVEEYVAKLRSQIASSYRTMALPHAGTTRRVTYDELFVTPKLRWAGADSEDNSDSGKRRDLGLTAIVESSLRTVVLGDPGGGKSTLARKLTYDLAVDAGGLPSGLVPLHVVLRDYSESFGKNRMSLKECLADICKNTYAFDPPAGTLEFLLLNSRAFIILDGLDELLDTALRRNAIKIVENFALSYPTVPILVTSRRVGYEDAALDPELFSRLGLINFTEEQVTVYVEKWFSLDESIEPIEQRDLAAAFVRDSAYVAELRSNPLLLSLMCGIYGSERYIPANRPDLYRRCAELLFERWDKQRGISVPLKFDAHVRMALYSLALHLYQQPSNQNGLSRMGMITYIKDFLWKKRFPDEADAENAAEQFIDYCTGRAWVLTDIGSDHYAFTHRTFLEYFAAQQLVRLNPSAVKLAEVLVPHLARKEWELIAQLAVQTLGAQVEDGADDFIKIALGICSKLEVSQNRSVVSFCARSLNFIVPNPEVIELICSKAVDSIGSSPGRELRFSRTLEDTVALENASAVLALRQCSIENLPLTMSYLTEALKRKVRSGPGWETELCLAINLGSPPSPDDGMRSSHLSRQHVKAFAQFADDNRADLNDVMLDYATRFAWVAMELINGGLLHFSETVAQHGMMTLYSFNRGGFTFAPPFAYRTWYRMYPSERKADREAVYNLCEDISAALVVMPVPWVLKWDDQLEFLIQSLASTRIRVTAQMNRHLGDAMLLTALPILESSAATDQSIQFGKTFRVLRQARIATDSNIQIPLLEWRSSAVETFVRRWLRGDINVLGPEVERITAIAEA